MLHHTRNLSFFFNPSHNVFFFFFFNFSRSESIIGLAAKLNFQIKRKSQNNIEDNSKCIISTIYLKLDLCTSCVAAKQKNEQVRKFYFN